MKCMDSRNPQADLQAMDRAHRIGQTKQVYIFQFITEVRHALSQVKKNFTDGQLQQLRGAYAGTSSAEIALRPTCNPARPDSDRQRCVLLR